MKNNRSHGLWLFLLALILSACGSGQSTSIPAPQAQGQEGVTAPAIGVQITHDNCPSIESKVDTQISWTNTDTVDLVLIIESRDDQDVIISNGGTDLLKPGDTFSVNSLSRGKYRYYCLQDRSVFGSILITP